jgi:hypothetical protein
VWNLFQAMMSRLLFCIFIVVLLNQRSIFAFLEQRRGCSSYNVSPLRTITSEKTLATTPTTHAKHIPSSLKQRRFLNSKSDNVNANFEKLNNDQQRLEEDILKLALRIKAIDEILESFYQFGEDEESRLIYLRRMMAENRYLVSYLDYSKEQRGELQQKQIQLHNKKILLMRMMNLLLRKENLLLLQKIKRREETGL